MPASCAALIDETLGILESWSSDEDQATTLAADMGPGDLSFTVTDVRGTVVGISTGLVEIEQEMLYVQDVDNDGTCTLPAWGRGYKSTSPASHAAGTRVVSQPSFPRSKILDAMNRALERMFSGGLFAVKSFESTTTVPTLTYDIPDDAQRVLAARWLVPDGRGYWQAVKRIRTWPGGGTLPGDGLNGVTADVADYMPPGQPIQFLYAAKPDALLDESDDYETTTHMPPGTRDLVTLGAAVALLPALELSRLQTASVEQQNRNGLVAPSAALTATRALEALYEQRLAEEVKAQQQLYPPRITGSWL